MRTIEDYLNKMTDVQLELKLPETVKAKDEAKKRGKYYLVSTGIPLYPTDDNQLLAVSENVEWTLRVFRELGYEVTGERIKNISHWDIYKKGEFKKIVLGTRDDGFSVGITHDPAKIQLKYENNGPIITPIGLIVEQPEFRILDVGGNKGREESEYDELIRVQTHVIMCPSGRGKTEMISNEVFNILETVLEERVDAFYGGFKTNVGVVNLANRS